MRRKASCAAVLCIAAACLLAGPVSGASASRASIKAVLRSYSAKIEIVEGKVVTAIGEYKTSHNPAPVDEAITNSITVISAVRTKIEHQSASAPRVKTAKQKLVKGLGGIIAAYEKLKTAYSVKAASPAAAEAEGEKALVALKAGTKELREAARLLG